MNEGQTENTMLFLQDLHSREKNAQNRGAPSLDPWKVPGTNPLLACRTFQGSRDGALRFCAFFSRLWRSCQKSIVFTAPNEVRDERKQRAMPKVD